MIFPVLFKVYDQCRSCLLYTSKGILNVDIPANIFGRLLAEIFIFREDQYSDVLRKAAAGLGRFIYVMDAWDDLKDDIKMCIRDRICTIKYRNTLLKI